MPVFTYPPEFLESLASFGLAPTSATPPALVRDALSDLYRHQLRALRSRLLAGGVARDHYQDHIVALRKRYWLLTLQLPAWELILAGLPAERSLSPAAPDPTAGPSSESAE